MGGGTPPSWTTVLSWVPTTTSTGWSLYTIRQRIDASRLIAGTELRLTVDSTGLPMELAYLYVGVEAAGNTFQFDASPEPVLFSGSPAISTAGGVFPSDVVSLAQDGTKNLILSAYFSGLTTLQRTDSGALTDELYADAGGDHASEVPGGTFSAAVSPRFAMATLVEVR